jgi:protein ImuB
LKGDGKGARRYTLVLFDTQNGKTEVDVRMARACREPEHIARILKERLAALEGRFDPASGFDAAALYATGVEPLQSRQTSLLDGAADGTENWHHVSRFLDRVTARLGGEAVTRFAFSESHWPERAARHVSALAQENILESTLAAPVLAQPRPLTLLPRPEPIAAIAAVPDYPPRKFVWRRCHHKVVKAEGPERISPEWWHTGGETPRARDYYVVEDEKGQRFWLYREGVYSQDGGQRWFMHGLFP